MSYDSWFWIVVGAVAFWFFVLRRKAPVAEPDNQPKSPPPLPDSWFERAIEEPETEKTPDELEIERAMQARMKIEEDARRIATINEEATREAKEKIARAEKIIQETGLDNDIGDLWDAVKHWPSWSSMPDRWTPPSGFTDISGGATDNRDQSLTSWVWEGKAYTLTCTEQPNYTPDYDWNPRDIVLKVDGEEVAALSYNEVFNDYGSDYKYVLVEALTVGPWMTDIVRLTAQLRLDQSRRLNQMDADYEAQRASRINL